MTIIIPAIFNDTEGNLLIFVDDIENVQEVDGVVTIIMKSTFEFETTLSLIEIQKKIEVANIKQFKFN